MYSRGERHDGLGCILCGVLLLALDAAKTGALVPAIDGVNVLLQQPKRSKPTQSERIRAYCEEAKIREERERQEEAAKVEDLRRRQAAAERAMVRLDMPTPVWNRLPDDDFKRHMDEELRLMDDEERAMCRASKFAFRRGSIAVYRHSAGIFETEPDPRGHNVLKLNHWVFGEDCRLYPPPPPGKKPKRRKRAAAEPAKARRRA